MNYKEIKISINPFSEVFSDIISSMLGEIGFESFIIENETLLAYITEGEYDEEKLKETLDSFPLEASVTYSVADIEQQNWNEEWEKNYFQPIILGNDCVIHSTFHKDIPAAKYDILIDPKMAFGTGHHETTSQMLSEILGYDFKDKNVLDMGCGTAVLAILALKCGAKHARAIDIDDWVCDNAVENCALNNIENISVECGDASLLSDGQTYDVILANINRNILLNDLQHYAKCMKPGAVIFMSGFYTQDVDAIKEEAEKQGLKFDYYKDRNNWVVIRFTKS